VKNPHPEWPHRWDSQIGGWEIYDGNEVVVITAALAIKDNLDAGDLVGYAREHGQRITAEEMRYAT